MDVASWSSGSMLSDMITWGRECIGSCVGSMVLSVWRDVPEEVSVGQGVEIYWNQMHG